jgi:hypothetical protein
LSLNFSDRYEKDEDGDIYKAILNYEFRTWKEIWEAVNWLEAQPWINMHDSALMLDSKEIYSDGKRNIVAQIANLLNKPS